MASFPARIHAKGASANGPGDVCPPRILALDYGRKRIGLALSDEMQWTATPLETLVRSNRRNDLRRLREICRKHSVGRIVVGLPLHITGKAGEMAAEASRFASRLEKDLSLPVVLLDERLTTWEARQTRADAAPRARKKHAALDSLAAAVLLRDYLSRNRGESPAPSAVEE